MDSEKKVDGRKTNPALLRKLKPDAVLASVIGKESVSRGTAIKKLWDYIKKHSLNKGREITADDKLKVLFGADKVTMFDIGRIVNQHFEKS